MNLRKSLATVALLAVVPTAAACGVLSDDDADASGSTTTTTTSQVADRRPDGGGPGAGADAASVSSEEELVSLIQSAYGDAGLGLHRGHQPVEDVLDEVLEISHDELHVRMEEQGQNLAAVAEDIGVDPQTLIDALVESWGSAIDALAEDGTITEAQAEQYYADLEEAFTFRVTWDGSEETPTYTGLDA